MRFLLATHEYPPFRGGVGRYSQEIARAVARRGHQVTVLAPGFGIKAGAEWDEDHKTLKVLRFRGGVYSSLSLPRLSLALWRAIRAEKWDCIHLCDWPMVVAAAVVRRWCNFEFSVTTHGTDVWVYRRAKVSRLVRVTRTLSQARQIVANSQYTAGLFRENIPEVAAEQVKFAYLGVGAFWSQKPAPAEVEAVKQRFSIDSESRCIISVARLDRRKGQNLTIKALGCLPETERQTLTYLIVGHPGEPGYMEELKLLALDCGVRVRFLAGLADHDVRALVAGSKIFILPGTPSHKGTVEGFGLAYLEAAALGVPAIGSNYAAVPEVVRQGRTGLLVEPDSVPALTAAISQLLHDEALLARLAGEAREFAQQFTWEKCAEETYKIYPQY